MHSNLRHTTQLLTTILTLVFAIAVGPAAANETETLDPDAAKSTTFALPAQPLADTLRAIGTQTNTSLVFDATLVEGRHAPALEATLSLDQALAQILTGTGLKHQHLNERTVILTVATPTANIAHASALRLAQSDSNPSKISETPSTGEEAQNAANGNSATAVKKEEEEDSERGGIPEILVTGSKIKSLNTDIRRTKDDTQPYVVFERETIERSGATDLHEFLRNNLTMNVISDSASQTATTNSSSAVNLRGLGSDETLILIDGRRAAPVASLSGMNQSDLNGIPLAAIERIEVLPTTASGIYGGGATGGVINVVLRRDYSGVEGKGTYGGTFDGGGTSRRLDMNAGFNLGAKTNVMMFGSYTGADALLTGERNMVQRYRQHVLGNDPAFLLGGAPPLGATPNIRSNVVVGGVRQNLVLDNGTPLNSTFTFIPVGYAGTSDGGTALIANAEQYNLDMPATAEFGLGARAALFRGSESKSLMMTLRQDVSSRLEAFLELQGSANSYAFPHNPGWVRSGGQNGVIIPASAPNNPFQQDIHVAVPAVGLDSATLVDSESRRAVGGIIVGLPGEWRSTIDYSWHNSRMSSERPPDVASTALTAMSDGSIDVLRDLNQFPLTLEANPFAREAADPHHATLKAMALRLSGPLPWSLPAGSIVLSILIEHREEATKDAIRYGGGGLPVFLFPHRSQEVSSVYIESQIPLVSPSDGVPGVKLLELQIAARRDDYSVNGATGLVSLPNPEPIERFTRDDSSTDPTIAVRYQPAQDVILRASHGTGYLPPSVSDLVPFAPFTSSIFVRQGVTDSLRGNELVGSVLVHQGGSPNLEPEISDSWSAGIIITPRWSPDLRISVDWSEIRKTDNIEGPAFTQNGLNDLITFFPERVIRAAPSDGFSVGRITEVNGTLLNVAALRVEAVDIALDYRMDAHRLGTLDFSVGATQLRTLKTRFTPSAPVVENIGVLAPSFGEGGLKWKGNATLKWAYEGWTLGWRTSYFDSYFLNRDHTVISTQGSATVPRQIYHDLFGGYRFSPSSSASVLADAEIQFGISNVFNKEPPVDVNFMYSTLADPRLANYYLSIRKGFSL